MKRFVTLLTVSITMAAVAFADHPVVEPETGGDVGFPFHPGNYMSTTLDAGCAWTECFCADNGLHSGREFPAAGDPTVILPYDVLRMNRTVGAGFNAKTYVEGPNQIGWEGMYLDITFYFAIQVNADALSLNLTANAMDAATFATLTAVTTNGLSFVIDRTSTLNATLSVYQDGTLVTSGSLPVADQNFHLMRVLYKDVTPQDPQPKVKVTLFELMEEEIIIPWTNVDAIPDGYVGFAGFVPVATGAYQYIDDICVCTSFDEEEVGAGEQAGSFTLDQNYPNPFNPATKISFTMPETGMASLKVFDLAGREVATLVNGLTARGTHNVVFDAADLSSGVYFYTFESAGVSDTRKMVLVK